MMKHNRLLWFDSDAFTPSAIIGKVGKQVEFSSHVMINKKKSMEGSSSKYSPLEVSCLPHLEKLLAMSYDVNYECANVTNFNRNSNYRKLQTTYGP